MCGEDLRVNKRLARYLNKASRSFFHFLLKIRGLTLIRAGIFTDTLLNPEASLTTRGLEGLMVAMVTSRAEPGHTHTGIGPLDTSMTECQYINIPPRAFSEKYDAVGLSPNR